MIEIRLARFKARHGLQVIAQGHVPAALYIIDEIRIAEIPELLVPILKERSGIVFGQEMRCPNGLGHRPPKLLAQAWLILPIQGIEKSTLVVIPAKLNGLAEQLGRRFRHPFLLALARFP